MNATALVLEHFVKAFNADTYKVQLKNRQTNEGFWVAYSPAQLLRAVSYLRGKNANGFDVYARPVGWQYVLLDDLTRDVLADVASLQPCLLMETSPDNFQAWLTLPEIPANRETAKAICQELALRFGADLASAEPDHVGRLPGFTNRKAKYQLPSGHYPFVKLHRWETRLSTFYPRGGAVLITPTQIPTSNPVYRHAPGKGSTSEQDFGVVCGLLRIGKTESEIYAHLLASSPDLTARKGKHVDRYLQRTITNARRALAAY